MSRGRHGKGAPDPYARRREVQRRRRDELDREQAVVPSPDDWTAPADDQADTLRPVRAPSALGDLLAETVRRRSWRDRLQGATAFDLWADIVGRDLAQRCEPVRIAGGTLVVRASDQAWATQLTYLQRQIVTRVNEVLGAGTVARVRITVGPTTPATGAVSEGDAGRSR